MCSAWLLFLLDRGVSDEWAFSDSINRNRRQWVPYYASQRGLAEVARTAPDYRAKRAFYSGASHAALVSLHPHCREQTRPFRKLVYAGHDWLDPSLARLPMMLIAEQVMLTLDASIEI